MNTLEKIISHTQTLPEPLLEEILDFICFLKLHHPDDIHPINDSVKEISLKTERGKAMASILNEAVALGLFQHFTEDPSAWQRELRKDRTLPGRE